MASDKGVVQFSEAVMIHYRVTFTGLAPRRQPREAQYEAVGAQRRRAEGWGAAQRGSGGSQGGADDQRDQQLQDQAGVGAGGDGCDNCEVSEAAEAGGETPSFRNSKKDC